MTAISAVIISYNEENNIARCINSLKNVADEIIVVDSYSTDKTIEIAKSLGALVISHEFEGYKEQKNYAAKQAANKYILSLDSDEALSEELEQSILKVKEDIKYDGYSFNRLNHYCGSWVRHSNWYPDKKLRLFNREKGEWKGINPHDKYILEKGSGTCHLKGDLLHWVLDTYEEHIEKANRFSSIAAREYFKLGKRASACKIVGRMSWRFFKAYFLKKGFLDGYNGFAISSLSAYTSFLKYLKLRQLNKEASRKKHSRTRNINITIAGKQK
ncbi:MAG: glycosyltransferase family 2 protein [Bacteroidales bacterium]|nr:glycosyltransferase family 2 protein [Bacteroidales bacterium]